PNGKVDRRGLPQPESLQPPVDYQSPRTPTEDAIVQIWKQVLNLPRLGLYENFFDIGGHSLLAVQIVGRIWTALEVELSVRSIFENPTVAELAAHIDFLDWAKHSQPSAELPESGLVTDFL
ncbi:MAG TPA: phosphopantetheine-binding protein, partial [Terrimicrobiaceae bacterium]